MANCESPKPRGIEASAEKLACEGKEFLSSGSNISAQEFFDELDKIRKEGTTREVFAKVVENSTMWDSMPKASLGSNGDLLFLEAPFFQHRIGGNQSLITASTAYGTTNFDGHYKRVPWKGESTEKEVKLQYEYIADALANWLSRK